MADWVLKISSFGGLVAGATHFRGRVEGPRPRSCHGGTVFHGEDGPLHGKTTCEEGHEIPRRAEWDVDAHWAKGRYERWAAKKFEGDGPGQFLDQNELIKVAVQRFRGELPDQHWEETPVRGEPGDRLFLGFAARSPEELDEEWGRLEGTPPWGSVLAEIPAAAT